MSDLARAREYATEMEQKYESVCVECDRLIEINLAMLEALKRATGPEFDDGWRAAALAAIAKAEGK